VTGYECCIETPFGESKTKIVIAQLKKLQSDRRMADLPLSQRSEGRTCYRRNSESHPDFTHPTCPILMSSGCDSIKFTDCPPDLANDCSSIMSDPDAATGPLEQSDADPVLNVRYASAKRRRI
jgi:hypothetical protein